MIGIADATKGRVECDGLILSSEAEIRAVPMLQALTADAELSHEATVGKVGAEQLNYLMTRGFTDEEATSLIVSGFMKLEVPNLPPALQKSIDEAVSLALSGTM
jgi:Fe-S cluster assembly scaffold protein SufB